MNKNKNFAGFTLIELLVVIVIVGILATISVSTFSGYIERARLAKAQHFAKSSQDTLFLQALRNGINNFTFRITYDGDSIDKSGTNVYIRDLSGQENDFEPFTGSNGQDANPSTDIPLPLGSGYSLDLNDSVRGFIKTATNTTNKPIQRGTFSTWFKYDKINDNAQYNIIFYVYQSGNNTVSLRTNKNGEFIFRTEQDGGHEIRSEPSLIREGLWHHVLAAYDEDKAKMKLWIDGNFIGEEIAHAGHLWGAGTMVLGGTNFKGKLDNSDFYPVVFEEF